jgi:hypothetical protein
MKVIDKYGIFSLEDTNMIWNTNLILRDRSRMCSVVSYAKGGYKTCVLILDARELDAAGLPKILRYETKFHAEWKDALSEYKRLFEVVDSITRKAHSWAVEEKMEQVAC